MYLGTGTRRLLSLACITLCGQASAAEMSDRCTVMKVPARLVDAYIESRLTQRIHSAVLEFAYTLAQTEGALEREFQKLTTVEAEFPVLALLEKDFGNEWAEFLLDQKTSCSRKDEDFDGVDWEIDGLTEDDLHGELLLFSYEEHCRDLNSKSSVRALVADFTKGIRELIEENRESDDGE